MGKLSGALPVNCHLDLPHGEHIEVAFCEGKALVFRTGQPKAKCQNGEREGEETGNDEEQCPQSETAEGKKEIIQNRKTPSAKHSSGKR